MIHCSAIKMSFILVWLSFLLSFEHAFWVSSISGLFSFHLAAFHHFSICTMNIAHRNISAMNQSDSTQIRQALTSIIFLQKQWFKMNQVSTVKQNTVCTL